MKVPTAFISYSWDSEDHKGWVASIASRLRNDGVEVILDQWHLVPGDQLTEFMEREIRESDYILIICTPEYKRKSDAREGGAGYEGDIMTAEVFSKRNNRKFIPILASNTWINSSPSWLSGKYGIDLSSQAQFERGYKDLITTIRGERAKPPPVGAISQSQSSYELTEIKILGVIVDEVSIPKMDGTQGSALYRIPFRLSETPSEKWGESFIKKWNRPPEVKSKHRPGKAEVSGDKIILNGTTIEEVEKFHRDTLVLCVEAANEEENRRLAQEKIKQENERHLKEQHEKKVSEVSGRLKF